MQSKQKRLILVFLHLWVKQRSPETEASPWLHKNLGDREVYDAAYCSDSQHLEYYLILQKHFLFLIIF